MIDGRHPSGWYGEDNNGQRPGNGYYEATPISRIAPGTAVAHVRIELKGTKTP